MSIRAYLSERNEIDSDRENFSKYITYIEREPFFNLWKQDKLFEDLFMYYGFDGTNNDCVGQLELTDEQFEEFWNNKHKYLNKWSGYDLEILDKIKKYFDDGNWLLQLECY